MSQANTESFLNELHLCADKVADFLQSDSFQSRFNPSDLREAVNLYVRSGGKRLRPAILLWSCGAMGREPETALPAAAAVELFHTWTLVHDDIIDRDERRRGVPTVHENFRRVAAQRYPNLSAEEQTHYGISVAVLSGDVQHGWGISILTDLTRIGNVAPEVTLHLIDRLDNEVLNLLVEGELLDIQYCYEPIDALSLSDIEDMLWKKTGVLYRFCAEAGALIGLGHVEPDHPHVQALIEFSNRCGVAFQLQDDLLGVIGDPQTTGKPVGNDIREGKRTSLVYYAYENAEPGERDIIARTLGKLTATESEIHDVIEILKRRGGIDQTRSRAQYHIREALNLLDVLPDTRYRTLLRSWAEFLVSRSI